jgi:hypothetical protein
MATKDNVTIAGTNGAGTTTTTPLPAEEKVEGETLTFDGWLDQQPENVKNLLDIHTKGLKSALDSEREIRKGFEKQLRDLAKKVEAGSEAETQLTAMADQQAQASRRADFYESAHREGVTNLKLAFTVAAQDELFDKKGNADFGEMKKSYPELFGAVASANANAGNGTKAPPKAGKSMNDFIRQASGHKS